MKRTKYKKKLKQINKKEKEKNGKKRKKNQTPINFKKKSKK